jgi:formate--tetrahydrofolate ligase
MPLGAEYVRENLELVEKGCENLLAHIDIVKRSGVRPIVCVNGFHTDTQTEIDLVRKIAEAGGARAVGSQHWLKGGDGAVELAEAVIESCDEENQFKHLYDLKLPLRKRIELIAKEVYGAGGVTYTDEALAKARRLEDESFGTRLGTCMAKTQLSLSHDPELKGRPTGWVLPINDILVYKGAGFVVPVAGSIKLMPGTGSNPAFRRIDVDVNTGKVKGLF